MHNQGQRHSGGGGGGGGGGQGGGNCPSNTSFRGAMPPQTQRICTIHHEV